MVFFAISAVPARPKTRVFFAISVVPAQPSAKLPVASSDERERNNLQLSAFVCLHAAICRFSSLV